MRVIDRAKVPDEPVGPPVAADRSLWPGTAGLVLGVSLALLRAGLRRGIKDPAEIEDQAAPRVLTTIPMSRKQRFLSMRVRESSKRLVRAGHEIPAGSGCRGLEEHAHPVAGRQDSGANMVVITGPTHSVGKSFISLNLAAVVGATGARVLLVDGDLRKGQLAKSLGVSQKRGLSDLLAGKLKFEEIVHRDVMPRHVDFISTGQVPESPADLLLARPLRGGTERQLRSIRHGDHRFTAGTGHSRHRHPLAAGQCGFPRRAGRGHKHERDPGIDQEPASKRGSRHRRHLLRRRHFETSERRLRIQRLQLSLRALRRHYPSRTRPCCSRRLFRQPPFSSRSCFAWRWWRPRSGTGDCLWIPRSACRSFIRRPPRGSAALRLWQALWRATAWHLNRCANCWDPCSSHPFRRSVPVCWRI